MFISYLSISISKNRDAILDFLRNPSLKNNHEELIKIYQKEIPIVDEINEIFINKLNPLESSSMEKSNLNAEIKNKKEITNKSKQDKFFEFPFSSFLSS